jgi:hypothetical protein
VRAIQTNLAAALALILTACAPEPSDKAHHDPAPSNAAAPAAAAPEPQQPAPPVTLARSNPLTLEGLGPLKIGEPVPANSGWAERGAQASDTCRTVTSPDVPGVYAIVEDGRVRRITLGERSEVKLIEGIGAGASEADVRAVFPGFREEPHKYVEAPGKYLTAPNAENGNPALRFEIGADRKVSLIHVGIMPTLGYVEGCS